MALSLLRMTFYSVVDFAGDEFVMGLRLLG